MKIYIKKNHQTADKRTRKLINKNGNEYTLIKYGHEHSYQRRYDILVKSNTTNWQGWLNVEHIHFETSDQNTKTSKK